MTFQIRVGDCLDVLKTLDAASVQTCVTSPPYFGLRDYGVAGQIGLEGTPDAYVAKLVAVFAEVRRVLKDDGTLWLNLGDSYANDTKWGGSSGGKHVAALHGAGGMGREKRVTGLKAKDLIGIPWRVAFALQADGWYLRSDIIWHKPNPMPESVTDRPTKAHEYLFLLAKGQWITRVIQTADLAGEIVHFGKHVGAQESLVREPVTKFCVRLATALFDGAQRKHDFSLPPFYAEEWKQLLDGGNCELIGDHPCEGRLAAVAACLLAANLSTKGFLEELDRLWLDLGARNALLIGRVQSLLHTPAVHVDADGAVTVHDAGEVCKFEFGHNRIVAQRTTTCQYYYDADAIAEEATNRDPGNVSHKGTAAYDDGDEHHRTKAGLLKIGARETRNRRTVWTVATQPYSGAHFATFPPALIEPCILAGTSPQACEHCGAPWQRVLDRSERVRVREGSDTSGGAAIEAAKGSHGEKSIFWTGEKPIIKTVGWEPTCDCENNTGAGRCVVLDPFGGAGTTGLVADRLGRNALLIELNPAYAQLARNRITDDAPLFADGAA